MKIQEIDFKRFSQRLGRTKTQKTGKWQPVGESNPSFQVENLAS